MDSSFALAKQTASVQYYYLRIVRESRNVQRSSADEIDDKLFRIENLWQSKGFQKNGTTRYCLPASCFSCVHHALWVVCPIQTRWTRRKNTRRKRRAHKRAYKNCYLSANLFICIYGRRRQNTNWLFSAHTFDVIILIFSSYSHLLLWMGLKCVRTRNCVHFAQSQMTIILKKNYWRRRRRSGELLWFACWIYGFADDLIRRPFFAYINFIGCSIVRNCIPWHAGNCLRWFKYDEEEVERPLTNFDGK